MIRLCIVIKKRACQRPTLLAPIPMDLQVHRLSQPNPGPGVFWRAPRSHASKQVVTQVASPACTVRAVAIWSTVLTQICGGGNGRGNEGYEERRHHESATQTFIITKSRSPVHRRTRFEGTSWTRRNQEGTRLRSTRTGKYSKNCTTTNTQRSSKTFHGFASCKKQTHLLQIQTQKGDSWTSEDERIWQDKIIMQPFYNTVYYPKSAPSQPSLLRSKSMTANP